MLLEARLLGVEGLLAPRAADGHHLLVAERQLRLEGLGARGATALLVPTMHKVMLHVGLLWGEKIQRDSVSNTHQHDTTQNIPRGYSQHFNSLKLLKSKCKNMYWGG